MSFIIWYKVQIDEMAPAAGGLLGAVGSFLGLGLPVKVSNDVLSGAAQILDADITLNLLSGAFASTFEVRLRNLPADVSELLKKKQGEGMKKEPLKIKVFLGYFDDLPAFRSAEPVLEGAVTRLKSEVGDDGVMETVLRGQELTGYKLRSRRNTTAGKADEQPVESFVKALLADTDKLDQTKVKLAGSHGLTETLKNFTVVGRSALDVLRQLADEYKLPVVVRDSQVFLKNAVGAGPAVDKLTEDDNIVRQIEDQDTEEARDADPPVAADKPGASGQLAAKPRTGLSLQVLGNPKLHPGQLVTVKAGGDNKDWRIDGVAHRFSTSSGFTTDLSLVEAAAGEQAGGLGGAFGVVQRVQDVVESSQRTPIDVGEITDYASGSDKKHLATLNYGQSPPAGAVAPSVVTPVNEATQLFSKPIASPFAFDKCGLIVPVYPKMRALLAHNRGLTNDAIIAGFLWTENPRLAPPENKPGDYWLCLPTELQNGLPAGKGVNDLTDAAGERVIQAKGLRIFVGDSGLPAVGTRPTVPSDLDGTIVIEHQKGAKITIAADGSVKIETNNQDISVTTGQVTLKLGGSSPTASITNGKVTLALNGSAVEVK